MTDGDRGEARADDARPRQRVLQVAHACHPDETMESRIGWRRALYAARRYDVTVLHANPANDGLLAEAAEEAGLADRLRFVGVGRGPLARVMNRTATTYYAGYRLWHITAYQKARRLHGRKPFDLVHQTTFCGYREPGLGWKLGVPFVWGPVGGTQAFPTAYLNQLGPRDAWIEVCRNAINAFQMRHSRRVRGAIDAAALVLAATRKAADDLRAAHGVDAPVRLETALDIPIGPQRPLRDPSEPFRLLWSGRLRAWKTLPLLLRALPLLPEGLAWRLRVLGVGSCLRPWQRLAERLGVADRIEWLGWPEYRDTLPHYRWADAFAFTSMRDTSGTGLLEALAAGAPIIGVDHQGAADIMTPDCAAPVPVTGPSDTIAGFAEQIARLATDTAELRRLSEGARLRATDFLWDEQAEPQLAWYAGVLADRATAYRPATNT